MIKISLIVIVSIITLFSYSSKEISNDATEMLSTITNSSVAINDSDFEWLGEIDEEEADLLSNMNDNINDLPIYTKEKKSVQKNCNCIVCH